MTRLIFSIIFAASTLSSNLTLAQSADADADADAGKAKSATCAACHAVDGNSTIAQFPKLAGQVPGYIAQQLAAYKSGERADPVMAGQVAALTERDMADLDAYYSSQQTSPGAISKAQESEALQAEAIFRGGLAEFGVPACMSCHGPAGNGIPPNFPKLAGQHAEYIEAQLLAFKTGNRANNIMQPIAFPLSEAQIKQLSLYISALN